MLVVLCTDVSTIKHLVISVARLIEMLIIIHMKHDIRTVCILLDAD